MVKLAEFKLIVASSGKCFTYYYHSQIFNFTTHW